MYLRSCFVLALVLVGSAHAAVDVSAATTGVSDAQTAVLGVMGSLVLFAAGIYGARRLLALLQLPVSDPPSFHQRYDSGDAVAGVDFYDTPTSFDDKYAAGTAVAGVDFYDTPTSFDDKYASGTAVSGVDFQDAAHADFADTQPMAPEWTDALIAERQAEFAAFSRTPEGLADAAEFDADYDDWEYQLHHGRGV